MNVLLIIPPLMTRISAGSLDRPRGIDIGHYPPLGLMYVAAGIRQCSSHRPQIWDLCLEESLSDESICEGIRRRSPDVVGVYATSITLFEARLVARMAKRVRRDLPVIVGGPHVSLYPRETLAFDCVDYVVRGEADLTAPALLDCLQKGALPEGIQGVGYVRNGQAVLNEEGPPLDLDSLGLPARDLTDVTRYYSVLGSDKVSTTIMCSRGCSFNCSFCYQPYGHRVRWRSPDSLCRELEQCLRMGIREFFFFDENFTLNPRWVQQVCQEIQSRGLAISFAVRSRVDTVTPALLATMRQAGCDRIQFGVESGTVEVLRAMNKRITPEQSRAAFRAAREAGLTTYADFMIGYPGETLAQIAQTLRFARDLDPDFVQFSVTKFLPGIPIYQEALASGRLKDDFWLRFAESPRADVPYPVASDRFGRPTMEHLQRRAYLGFYFRPRYLLRRLVRVRSLRELFRQGRAAAGLLAGHLPS
jgi:anaerobic magnesium-protoporphyrin IX monomethyl ester cyclase